LWPDDKRTPLELFTRPPMDTPPADREPSFRRAHPVFFWGAVALTALFTLGSVAVALRVPRYHRDIAELNRSMTATQRATRDSLLASRARRTRLALAVLRRDMRIRSFENRKRHLAISIQDSALELRQGTATLRRARIRVGADSTIRGADGRSWRLVRPLGERHIARKLDSPDYTIPEWVYVGRGQPVPPEPQRRMPGALGAYVIQLDDGTEIYSRPSAGPFAEGVKPGAFVASHRDLEAIFGAVGEDTPVYIY
jgi:hypothetical protein